MPRKDVGHSGASWEVIGCSAVRCGAMRGSGGGWVSWLVRGEGLVRCEGYTVIGGLGIGALTSKSAWSSSLVAG